MQGAANGDRATDPATLSFRHDDQGKAPVSMSDRGRAALEAEVASYKGRHVLSSAVDELLERAMQERLPLSRTVEDVMPPLAKATGAAVVRLRTYGEDLVFHEFAWGDTDATMADEIGWDLDVAGQSFGQALLGFSEVLDETEKDARRELLESWCEELDNFLAAIARARFKHRITSRLSDALKSPVLGEGIQEAVAVLSETVDFDDLVLAYHHEDDRAGETLSFRVFREQELLCDSRRREPTREDRFMREHARAFIAGDEEAVLSHFRIDNPQEQVLINGIADQRLIGRLVVNHRRRELNTFDRDLLERFADYLRQRIVDFNREYKHLALNFAAAHVQRLLGEAGYQERYLAPRQQEVAILYTDIAGFTRLSEQVLAEPSRIGSLIDTWSNQVVQLVWESGGVFDKMVGDCIIALWGPPFFDTDHHERCRAALEAAERIRDYTASLSVSPDFPELREAGIELGVCTGLNFCEAHIGFFGPNLDYTAFGAGMNNAARLQGVAVKGEILCMERFVETLGSLDRFGEPREAMVKNVAAPLRFRALA